MSSTNLDNLIFVDESRLDDYLTRLDADLFTVDKSKKVESEWSITGPKVTFTQDESRRKLDVHARCDALYRQLDHKEKLASSRPAERHTPVEFVAETLWANRILIPSNAEPDQPHPAFAFWISRLETEAGLVCLLENCDSDDDAPFDYSQCSTYTVLQSLVYFSRRKLDSSALAKFLPHVPHPNPHAKMDETHPPSLFHEYNSVKEHLYEFTTNPIPLLEAWGATVTPERFVRCLYRVREYGPDSAYGWEKITTFGYPVYIYDAEPTEENAR